MIASQLLDQKNEPKNLSADRQESRPYEELAAQRSLFFLRIFIKV